MSLTLQRGPRPLVFPEMPLMEAEQEEPPWKPIDTTTITPQRRRGGEGAFALATGARFFHALTSLSSATQQQERGTGSSSLLHTTTALTIATL